MFMAQWMFVEWLLIWLLQKRKYHFEWDDGNLTKNRDKHNVTLEEAESVFKNGRALPLGVQIRPTSNEERYGLIGLASNGKILQIAFVFREKKIRIISARPANIKERIQYEESIRKIFKDL